jgi:cytochrome P450
MLDHNESVETGTDGAERHHVLPDAEVISQAFVFFTAGYETTSTALMFIAYNRKFFFDF